MIYSMTGFAKIARNADGFEHTCEVKTLNHKYADVKLCLPGPIESYEHEISELLRNEIKRGSIRLSYSLKNINIGCSRTKLFDVDIDAAKSYHDAYLKVSKLLNMNYVPDISVIMHHSGVMTPVDEESFKDKEIVMSVVCDAIKELNKFRATEGKKLARFVLDRIKALKGSIKEIAKHSGEVKDIYFDRMKERITEFKERKKVEIDDSRLMQEVAMLADKTDISEEIERFNSHLKYFETLLKGEEKDPIVGRKMDFMCQELFREITTISNKVNLVDITKIAIEVKSEIEKIREQVQNIQ